MTVSSDPSHAGRKKLIHQVGDYVGYENAELRLKSDAAIRRHLTAQLVAVLKQLEQQFRAAEAQDQQRLDALASGARRKVKTICASLRNPTYEQTHFFDGRRMTARELGRIYDLEIDMLETSEHLRTEVAGLQNNVSRSEFEDRFLHIQNFVDNFNQSLFEREALIIGDL